MRKKVLLIDDDPVLSRLFSVQLRGAGYDVAVACDGVQSISAVRRERPDVILLDIGLPGLNGYEVCRRVRAQPWGTRTVLIALTGWGQDEDRQRSKEAGFDRHLVKPVGPADLAKVLAALPGGRGA